ncbi:hypothetical protein Tco_0358799 [Tanacetum coccineum]
MLSSLIFLEVVNTSELHDLIFDQHGALILCSHSVTSNKPPGNQKKNPINWGQETTEAKDADTTSLPLSKETANSLTVKQKVTGNRLSQAIKACSLVLFCIICSYEINGDDEGCDANDDDSDCGKDTG